MPTLAKRLKTEDGRTIYAFTLTVQRMETKREKDQVTEVIRAQHSTGWVIAVSEEEAYGKVLLIANRLYPGTEGWKELNITILNNTSRIIDDPAAAKITGTKTTVQETKE